MPDYTFEDLEYGWKEVITLASASKKKRLSSLIVNFEGQALSEALRDDFTTKLNGALIQSDCATISTVANTIFPSSLWDPVRPRAELYSRYEAVWPRVATERKNRRGTYFRRLIAYPGSDNVHFNQLEHVICTYLKGIRRRSALQCSIVVPSLDLRATPYQGFPCMQQLSFVPDGNDLTVCGYYPTQYLWERALGNYMGIARIGQFVARETGLVLRRASCITVSATLEQPQAAAPFLQEVQNAVR